MIERLLDILAYNPANPMLFNSGLFLVLFTIFLIVFQLLRGYRRLRMLFVIAFSLYFYYKSSSWCVFILCGVCLSDWLLGKLLGRTDAPGARKAIVAVNVLVNVGMLVYFKYFNLLADAITSIVSVRFNPVELLLPAGISFFTFRSISYIVDIYRRQLDACESFLDYAFYLTFFPPLLAGPVVRAKDMLPQIKTASAATPAMMSEGMFLILTGLVKKVVIADYISGNFVDRIFDNPLLYSGFENLMGCIGFTIQLYCDFSGYSDMAIGLALLLGYRFKDNFSAPFKAQNPTEFWHRWHISLSTWLRDYVYIPLGGNRHGKARAYINQIITMVIGGLWHGASWMYLLWGAYHGVLLVIHKWLRGFRFVPEPLAGTAIVRVFNIFITFSLVVAGFTIFRSPDINTTLQIATQIFTNFHLSVAPQFMSGYMLVVAAMAVGYLSHISPKQWTIGATGAFVGMSLVWQSLLIVIVLFFVVQTRSSELIPFIYLSY